MSLSFVLIGLLTVGGALASMMLRNLVHCALALTVVFAGLAVFYLQLGAQFVGFAQIIVYIGAVAILIVFAILLTRAAESSRQRIFSSRWAIGLAIALVVFGILGGVVLLSRAITQKFPPIPEVTVRQIGDQLMSRYVLPLEVVGLLLTVALIGAVIIALQEKEAR